MSLEIHDLSLRFGGLSALNRVSLEADDGELVAIVGPNGAGKTALLNCINGVYRPAAGRIVLDGPASELRADPRIGDAYLGGQEAA